MDYVYIKKDGYSFSLKKSLECGQFFHFEELSEGEYAIVIKDTLVHAREYDDRIIFYGMDEEVFEERLAQFFDLNRDYDHICKCIVSADPRLEEAVVSERGLRIFSQDFFECLISFIISANNQIPRIKRAVFDISRTYGREIGNIAGRTYYAFPAPCELARADEETLRDLKVGFRASYIMDAVSNVLEGRISYGELLGDEEACLLKLKSIKGVGNKVAACVMLFSLGYYNAFPVDTWIKKIMQKMYMPDEEDVKKMEEFGRNLFGEYGGFAQQYLFVSARKKPIKE